MSNPDTNLVWMDLEMTGLHRDVDRIIEMATIITDSELNILAEGPVIAVQQSSRVMSAMDDWNTQHHGQSGLTERVLTSPISTREAESQTLAFIKKWVNPGKSPLCGNSISQDRRFLVRYMPELEAFFHYRNIDVSTIKELTVRWQPDVMNGFTKKGAHLALEDIQESIAELQFYRKQVFKI